MKKISKSRAISLYAHYVSRYKTRFFTRYGFDIVMDRREGIYFWDLDGKRFINLHCNGGVFNLGHRNPQTQQALSDALEQFDIGNHHLISGMRGQLARKLCDSFRTGWFSTPFSESIDTVVFAVSGGEAVDLAIKLARGYTRKTEIISISGGYHGHTGLALGTGDEKYRDPFYISLPGFRQIPFVEASELERFVDDDTAAVILETVPATLGMPIFPESVLRGIRRLTERRNIPLILDEIQTGLGRTGLAWGFQHYDILPDIVVTGKGLSGGLYPIAATCFRKKYERVFKNDPFVHISTFGGSELACAVALKTLELSTNPEFLRSVRECSQLFVAELEQIKSRFPIIQEIRHLGLFMGIVFEDQ
ncbi:MAG: aspartate aminotransferase family protein, partial [Leptospiraceae bacterium]|nr:aspartate aminotransferase family protein [Leptospiraceae bacterium]